MVKFLLFFLFVLNFTLKEFPLVFNGKIKAEDVVSKIEFDDFQRLFRRKKAPFDETAC